MIHLVRPSFIAVLIALVSLIPAPAAPPEAPPPRPAPDPALADWTPRPATGIAEEWEKAIEANWVDGRFRDMDTGPFLNCTMRYPLGKGHEMVYKATVVKLGDKGGVVFDRSTMRMAAGWARGWLQHSDRRFGLMNTPTPKGEMVFAAPEGAGWAASDGKWEAAWKPTRPLPSDWAAFRGLYLCGNRTVLNYRVDEADVFETFRVERADGFTVLTRTINVARVGRQIETALLRVSSNSYTVLATPKGKRYYHWGPVINGRRLSFAILGDEGRYDSMRDEGFVVPGVVLLPSEQPVRVRLLAAMISESELKAFAEYLDSTKAPDELSSLTKGGPRRWGEPIVTKLVRGADAGPFAVDTLTIPYKNRFNALFFCTGLDHLPNGRIAVCTCHGDVWLVTVDERAGTCSWQRYATGLYHPLGLKVVDGKVVVLETGQLTRLHDLNNDGEADFYECITNGWHTGGGEHSYDTCLETDRDGNFYFFKTGDTHTPHGGCLLKVSKDGSKVEVFATGFRHPIGLGMSPTGILTGADQEGNWMPATRIDEYRKGGFYGDLRAHHRKEAPKTYDPPLCWLPREVDNSAGGQVWVPKGEGEPGASATKGEPGASATKGEPGASATKGEPGASATGGWVASPLAGLPLHLSYGRCKPFVLLRQQCANGVVQGGVAGLDIKFLSGICRGRFGPDGHLYVCGLNGWQTAAQADGCLQRVRSTGKPLDVPVGMVVDGNAIRLTFSRPLDARSVSDTANYRAAWWNYIWSGEYGSKRWKVSDPMKEGQDEFAPRVARLLDDGRTVELTFENLIPVMQMQIGYNLNARDGKRAVGSVYLTINSTRK
jgi:hypothetical protein